MVIKKTCFKCNIEWPLIFFYKHSQMKDGHLNKCKKCSKKDALENRKKNIEKVRAYDRCRAKSEKRKKHITNNTARWRKKNPDKYKAHCKLNNALRDNKIKKGVCCVCGSHKVHGHHEDYSKPLEVIWVCAAHHRDIE